MQRSATGGRPRYHVACSRTFMLGILTRILPSLMQSGSALVVVNVDWIIPLVPAGPAREMFPGAPQS